MKMNWLFKFLKKQQKESEGEKLEPTSKWDEGRPEFEKGVKLFQNFQHSEALICFDNAINLNYHKYENRIYGYRAWCLLTFNYNLEAIEDFDLAINEDSNNSNNYYGRSISKGRIGNFQGEIDDLKKALQIHQLDNKINKERKARDKKFGTNVFENLEEQILFSLTISEQEFATNVSINKMLDEIGPNADEKYLHLIQERENALKRRTTGNKI